MEKPSARPYAYEESLQDYIYRRFFKAGVAIVLTVGCLWGVINLLQIGLGMNFLQLRLLSPIPAHAHAMIFGWVGMFVMGFAYQSFPRFKNTTLWRPGLANLSFYLLGSGIMAGMAAEILLPTPVSFVLGAFSGAMEIAAVVIFMLVLYRTARKSIEPHNPYEKFIASSFIWFLLGTVLEAVFFFAKATAHSEHGLIMRIALIDGPLRDIQLLGLRRVDHRRGQPAPWCRTFTVSASPNMSNPNLKTTPSEEGTYPRVDVLLPVIGGASCQDLSPKQGSVLDRNARHVRLFRRLRSRTVTRCREVEYIKMADEWNPKRIANTAHVGDGAHDCR